MSALGLALAALVVALGIRVLAGQSVLDSSGALVQCSGTALYASMIYAGVLFVRLGTRPVPAAVAAVLFCWAVELFQLTGIPAALSARSMLARLALGIAFDPIDMAWYPVGIVPLAAVHLYLANRRERTSARR